MHRGPRLRTRTLFALIALSSAGCGGDDASHSAAPDSGKDPVDAGATDDNDADVGAPATDAGSCDVCEPPPPRCNQAGHVEVSVTAGCEYGSCLFKTSEILCERPCADGRCGECANDCGLGNVVCSERGKLECVLDGAGCPSWKPADDAAGCEQCTTSCELGSTECSAGQLSTCEQDGACTRWSAQVACALGSCSSASACSEDPGEPLGNGTCSPDGWCWMAPRPQGHTFFDIAAFEDHLWAVGEGGTIVHRTPDGAFTTEQWPNLPALRAVAPVGADQVWVVGQGGLIIRFASGGWSSVDSGTSLDLRAVRAFAPNDIWAGGGNDTNTEGVLLHYDGTSWTKVAPPFAVSSVHSFGGTSSSDLYVGGRGYGGYMLHHDGSNWRYVTELLGRVEGYWQNFTSIHEFAGNLYVSSDRNDGRLWRLQNGQWSALSSGEYQSVHDLAVANGELWALGTWSLRSYDGASFRERVRWPTAERGALLGSTEQLWMAGQSGRITTYRDSGSDLVYGMDWPGSGTSGLFAARAADDLWWVDRYTVRYDGERWTKSLSALPLAARALHAGPEHVWATSSDKVLRWDGTDWQVVYTAPDYLDAIWESPSGHVWAGGPTALIVFDGTSWRQVTEAGSTSNIYAIHGSADNNVWFVGSRIALHYDGANFTRWWTSELGNDWLTAVHVLGQSSVWAGGSDQRLYHFDGDSWTAYPSDIPVWITSIEAFSERDVWAVGAEAGTRGFVTRFDGERWAQQRTGCARGLYQLAKQDANTLWAAGDGALLRWVRP